MHRKSKDDLVYGVVFRDSRNTLNWSLMASGSGRKDSPNYGIKTKRITRSEGLALKKKFGLGEHRDSYGSYGYAGKVPKSIFD